MLINAPDARWKDLLPVLRVSVTERYGVDGIVAPEEKPAAEKESAFCNVLHLKLGSAD